MHFKLLPEVDESEIDDSIEAAVGNMQAVITEGRKVRERNTLPLKTPLKTVTVIHRDGAYLESLEGLKGYIKSELNVYDVVFSADEEKYVSFKAEPNNKVLGQRLGKDAKVCKGLINAMSQEQMKSYLATSTITLGDFTLTGDDVLINCSPKEPEPELQT